VSILKTDEIEVFKRIHSNKAYILLTLFPTLPWFGYHHAPSCGRNGLFGERALQLPERKGSLSGSTERTALKAHDIISANTGNYHHFIQGGEDA